MPESIVFNHRGPLDLARLPKPGDRFITGGRECELVSIDCERIVVTSTDLDWKVTQHFRFLDDEADPPIIVQA